MKEIYVLCAFVATLLFAPGEVKAQQLQVLPNGTVFTRALGNSIIFTCLLSGQQIGVIINIKWLNQQRIEIRDLTPGRDNTPYIDKSEPLTNKLYIVNIMAKHAGNYYCSADIGGNTQEIQVTLQLYGMVTFVEARTPQTPTAYTDALILCTVTGNPIPTVYWRYRGQRITLNSHYSQEQFGLRIRNITDSDAGIYTCCAEVQTEGVYATRDIEVFVYHIPVITRAPFPAEGISSQQFTLTCVATGNPVPRYEFYKDGNTAPYFSTDRVQFDGELGAIQFRPLIPEDRGSYECRAFNTAGEDRAASNLRVIVPPSVYNIRNVTGVEGDSATLICLSWGDPAPDMTYRKETLMSDYVLGSNDHGRIVLTNPVSGELRMTINPLEPDDMANYTCKSRNVAGYHERNGTVFVNFAPRFPVNQTAVIYNWAGKTRNLTCKAQAWPVPLMEWLRYGRVLLNNETFRTYVMGRDSNLQVTVRQVDEGYIYGVYTCRARNQYGVGTYNVTMLRADLAGPPFNASVIQITQTTVLLAITLPLNNGGVPVFGFYVQYMTGKIIEFMLGDTYYIEYLRPHTTYSMIIRARTEVGLGQPLVFDVTTPEVSVPYPIDLICDPRGVWPFIYIISWNKPLTGGLAIRDYEFKFRRVNVQPGIFPYVMTSPIDDWMRRMITDDYNNPMMYFQLEQLYPSSYYQLQVRAMNDIGWSDPNPTFVFSTTEGSQALYDPWANSSTRCRPLHWTVAILAAVFCTFTAFFL